VILNPKLIVCDEPVSALDVSIAAQIINLLMRLQREFNLSLLLISHDLSVVRQISHRVLLLYLGRPMEIASRDELYAAPRHPYTQALISAVPIPGPQANKPPVLLTGDCPRPSRHRAAACSAPAAPGRRRCAPRRPRRKTTSAKATACSAITDANDRQRGDRC
jgi:oligopeptide/dipeptide ABC transporter ATP-binding protein